MTTIYLAHAGSGEGDALLYGKPGVVEQIPKDEAPGLLVSYVYLRSFEKKIRRCHFREWVLDSGAFSARNIGKTIVLQDYIDKCKALLAMPTHAPVEVYGLDVIGDWVATKKNIDEMWRQGVPAIPTYHLGEPEAWLHEILEKYPKIALGGVADLKGPTKMKWAAQVFARAWPKKIHGFACVSEKMLMALPFHSSDSTSWTLGPAAFGHWKAFGGEQLRVRGAKMNLRVEVEWYMDLEKRLRARWRKEMEELDQS